MIIYVGGIPGSGKTYICSQLKHIKNAVCIDLDDVVNNAYRTSRDSDHFKKQIHADAFPHTWDKNATLLKEEIIQANKDKILVLVGIDKSIDYDKAFFIKIDDLDHTYRRYMKRELNKVIDNQKRIRDIIEDTKDPYFVDYDISAAINSAGLFIPYSSYETNYNNGLEQAKKNDHIVLTQKEIIDEIKKLAYE
jgi:adenylate kinase family enzyme